MCELYAEANGIKVIVDFYLKDKLPLDEEQFLTILRNNLKYET